MSQLKSKTILFLFVSSLLFSFNPHVSKADEGKETERILVTYEHTKSPSKQSEQHTKIDVIEVPSTEVNEMINQLELNNDVKHVEKDQPIYLMDEKMPNDSLLSYQKSWVDQIHLPNAWKVVPNTDSSLKVAVIDSGVDLFTPRFKDEFNRWD